MKYETVKELNENEFKRATGVKRSTFEAMRKVIREGSRNFGRPTTLGQEDQLLLTLMYWREYRTEFHIGLSYGISESAVCRTIQKIETLLLASKQFHLPGKKALKTSESALEIIIVDATEQTVERPKKTAQTVQRQEKASYTKSPDRG